MVHINGKDIDAAGQSLAAYLKANDYEIGTFVVECNEEIIHKEDYENYMLKDGDIIEIDIPSRSISVHLTDEELAARPMRPLQRKREVSKALRAYASMVSSADKGGVREID